MAVHINYGFTFKAVKPKKKRSSNTYKRITKLCYCECVADENGEWKAKISLKNDIINPDIMLLPFTEKSYNLKGKTIVFSTQKDKLGIPIQIIRTQLHATVYPGTPEQYTPFRENFIYKGYVVRYKDVLYFDIVEAIGHYKYYSAILNETLDDNELEPLFK